MTEGRRWTVKDRYGNEVYLTQERWHHITEAINHPEMLAYEGELRQTIQQGRRRQDPINPQKYRYTMPFDTLIADNTHIVAIVLFRLQENAVGELIPNNYIVTAFQKEVW